MRHSSFQSVISVSPSNIRTIRLSRKWCQPRKRTLTYVFLCATLASMTANEVRALLREDIGDASAASWAASHGLTRQYLSDVLRGRRDPGPTILDALGLNKAQTVTYERSA